MSLLPISNHHFHIIKILISVTCFGLQAPSSLKHQASPVAATKKTKTVFKRRESKVKSDAPLDDEGQITSLESSGGVEPVSSGGDKPCPSTPPPKDEAFEQFKRERGCEINKILLVNKGQPRSSQWSFSDII